MRHHSLLPLTLCFLLSLTACSGPSPEQAWKDAQKHYQAQDFQAARIALMNAGDAYRESKDFAVLEARIHISLGDGIAAEAAAKRASQLGAAKPIVNLLTAESHLLLGRPEKALEMAEAGEIQPAYTSDRIAGEALMSLGRLDEAKARLGLALASGQDAGRVHIMLGNLARISGDLEAAHLHATTAQKMLPRHPGGPLLLAQLAALQDKHRLAASHFGKVLALRPTHHGALVGKTSALIEAGDFDGAGKVLAKLLAAHEGNPQGMFLKARLAFAKGDVKAAHATMQSVAHKLNDDPKAMAFAGELALKRKLPSVAEVRFEQAIFLDPDTLHLRYLLARAQFEKGDPEAALQTLQPFDTLEEPPVEVAALQQQIRAADAGA